ncbi:MAG: hypothetical protein ABIG96_05265 [Candidatus Micrarchaeota archaeon]
MKFAWLFAFALFMLLLIQPISADCLYMKNKDGYPLGIIPSVLNITAIFVQPEQQNQTFKLYIESEAGTSTSIECRVDLSIENESNAMKVELSNYSLETGAAFIERPIKIILTPINLVNFPEMATTYIKITDVDNRKNFALLPIYSYFRFKRTTPTPSAQPVPSVTKSPKSSIQPTPTNSTNIINNLLTSVEDSSSKYVIAVVAFFFLAALLWIGFNSLQRE